MIFWEENFIMKRILTCFLVLCVLFSFFACAKKEKEPSWEDSLDEALSDLEEIKEQLQEDELQEDEPEAAAPVETEPVVTEKVTETTKSASTGLGADFKAAMDRYESFMNDYVAFMKKYQANPTDFSLLSDYADYMAKYADFVTAFEKWEEEELNVDELSYYIEVQARVSQKLLEVVG